MIKINLLRAPSLKSDGFEVATFGYLCDAAYQEGAKAVYGNFTPGRNARNKLCRGVRWGVYTHDTFLWHHRDTYSLSASSNPQEAGAVRRFDLIPDSFLQHTLTEQLLRDVFGRWQFADSCFDRAYECQLSAIRYEPTLGASAEPSPPYPHHDEVDGAVVVLNKESVIGGINRLFDNADQPLYEFCLEPGSGFLVKDDMLKHYVSDLQLPMGANKGFRDVLIIRFQPLGR
ncbi:MAG: 2OG-Fe dioxygenase family protein [Planctomycetaceae bacterium]|nr:2OG-Fe dioxygenase family protein [Planctomycetaceae bacterium]